MNYRIEEKQAFKVRGISQTFNYETCFKEIPNFWKQERGSIIGEFGIALNNEENMTYIIADYQEHTKEGTLYTIPSYTWAIFSCEGPLPHTLQQLNSYIFNEWLQTSEYNYVGDYCIELYSDPSQYKKGTQDTKYYSEIWIPVIKK